MNTPLIIYGAGGHGRVAADVAELCGYSVVGFFDDRPERYGSMIAGRPMLGHLKPMAPDAAGAKHLFIAIGDNEAREHAANRATAAGWRLATLVHPSAQIGSRVEIGADTVVMANSVINADARIGAHVIVNTGATIDHDCGIADLVHVGPGANLAGQVSVGRGTQLGIGSTVIPGIVIAEGVTVGAGATVVDPLPPRVTAVGTPARPIGSRGGLDDH